MYGSGFTVFVLLAIAFSSTLWVLPRLFGRSATPEKSAQEATTESHQTDGVITKVGIESLERESAHLVVALAVLFVCLFVSALLAVYVLVHGHIHVPSYVWIAMVSMLIMLLLYLRPFQLIYQLLDTESTDSDQSIPTHTSEQS